MDTITNFFGRVGAIRLPQINIADILQIIIIAVVLYYFLIWVRQNRTWFLIRGILLLLVFYLTAVLLEWNTILFIFRNALGVVVTAMVVVFQPELRKVLEQLGQTNVLFNRITGGRVHTENEFSQKTIEELVKASFALGKTRTGALMVLEQRIPLLEYENTGIEVDAVVTSQLLINIFEHNTPLHDGAVIIKGNRVAAATCYLPLSKNPDIPKSLGTRHRAAIGLSESTDSVTIVVSEETGRVTIAQNGVLTPPLNADSLRERLDELKAPEQKDQAGLRFWKGRRKNEKDDSE